MDKHDGILCVGDIHGYWPAINGAFAYARREKVHPVFMGDFLDSFTASPETQIRGLKYVLDACESGEATSLLGNHEASYLWPKTHSCSGFNQKTFRLLLSEGVMHRVIKNFRSLATVKTADGMNILLSHAGVHRIFWEDFVEGKTFDEKVATMEEMADNPHTRFYQVGMARGGSCMFGGPLWCDWDDEFVPIPGVIQITGHNNTVGTPKYFKQEFVAGMRRSTNGDWNIDNVQRDLVGLRVDTDGKQTPVALG